ncbi:MAG: VOC family protein [Xanthobacteraceae bacterium]|jgi:catechol 2,3-dioxygenase-like lactoylglutathione lyase family enzyme
MIQAKRIGHASFVTPDLDRQIDYYQGVIGLALVARETNRAFLATPTGQLTIVLEKGSSPACARIAFEVSPALSMAEMSKRLQADGLKTEERSDAIPGMAKTIAFTDPKGTTIELFSEWKFLDGEAPAAGSVMPNKLGHLAYVTPDPKAAFEFYAKVLGFRLSDWIGDYFVFLRCGVDHHTANFIRGPNARMHHIAFEVRDMSQLANACDLLGRKNLEIVWGPVRHGPGHNVAVYHRNPDDQMVEFFTDLDKMIDEEAGYFEPRSWHKDRPQKPKVWDPAQQRDMWGLPPGPHWRRANE